MNDSYRCAAYHYADEFVAAVAQSHGGLALVDVRNGLVRHLIGFEGKRNKAKTKTKTNISQGEKHRTYKCFLP